MKINELIFTIALILLPLNIKPSEAKLSTETQNKLNEELIEIIKRPWLEPAIKIAEIEKLLKDGANINFQNIDGKTPLLIASITNIFEASTPRVPGRNVLKVRKPVYPQHAIIKYLLENGADYKVKDFQGNSFFDYATKNPEVAKAFAEFEKEIADKSGAVCKKVLDAIATFPAPIAKIVSEYIHSCPRE